MSARPTAYIPRERKASFLPGTTLISPLLQGDLDGLCGLYAVINAIRLACAPDRPITHREAEVLFSSGVKHLRREYNLSTALHRGMPRKQQRKLAKALLRSATLDLQRPLQIRPVQSPTGQYHAAIWDEIDLGNPVCALFDGALDHYTVISGVSHKRLTLFDSTDLSWVSRASCRYGADPHTARHHIKARSLFAVTRQEGDTVRD